MSSNKKYRPGKKLTFRNRCINLKQNSTQKQPEYLNLAGANIAHLSSDNSTSSSIKSAQAEISGIGFSAVDGTSFIDIVSQNGLVVRNGQNTIIIPPTGAIQINGSILADIINAIDLKLSGDIEANNIGLLGNMDASFGNFENINANGSISTGILKSSQIDALNISSNSIVSQNLSSIDGVYQNSLTVGSVIESPHLSSLGDLALSVPIDHTVNVPNIRYNIDITDNPIISPAAVKFSRIFVVTRNVSLTADGLCNGIEIVIYNKSKTKIRVNDRNILTEIEPHSSKKFIYIHPILRWIIA